MKKALIFLGCFSLGVWTAHHFDLSGPIKKFDRIIHFTWNEIKPSN